MANHASSVWQLPAPPAELLRKLDECCICSSCRFPLTPGSSVFRKHTSCFLDGGFSFLCVPRLQLLALSAVICRLKLKGKNHRCHSKKSRLDEQNGGLEEGFQKLAWNRKEEDKAIIKACANTGVLFVVLMQPHKFLWRFISQVIESTLLPSLMIKSRIFSSTNMLLSLNREEINYILFQDCDIQKATGETDAFRTEKQMLKFRYLFRSHTVWMLPARWAQPQVSGTQHGVTWWSWDPQHCPLPASQTCREPAVPWNFSPAKHLLYAILLLSLLFALACSQRST